MGDKNIADLERAVEEAWDAWDDFNRSDSKVAVTSAHFLDTPIAAWIAARRAARDAGYVSVMLPRDLASDICEAVAVKDPLAVAVKDPLAEASRCIVACEDLAPLLAAVLKGDAP